LILFDRKHWEEGRHIAGTGVGLTQIVANLRAAVQFGFELLVRIPVIPGYNDADADAIAFAAELCDLGITRAQLLPFHPFGESKYAALGRNYAYKNAPALHADALSDYIRAFQSRGIDAFI
ncbi:MAG: glycyl-radical enzyme activating protein, partial [Christensenellales bacterium]|jgi:pyruvate formate lyase activating enzyme